MIFSASKLMAKKTVKKIPIEAETIAVTSLESCDAKSSLNVKVTDRSKSAAAATRQANSRTRIENSRNSFGLLIPGESWLLMIP